MGDDAVHLRFFTFISLLFPRNQCRNGAADRKTPTTPIIAPKSNGCIMAVTQADIDNLNAAIASGTRSATIGGQIIVYQTVDALIKARNDMKNELAALTPPTVKRSRQTYAYLSDRGYN